MPVKVKKVRGGWKVVNYITGRTIGRTMSKGQALLSAAKFEEIRVFFDAKGRK